jgi:hypothetical protein
MVFNHYTNEQTTARGETMKGLLIGLLALGSISAFAQEDFNNPRFRGSRISASSNKDAVCKLLSGSGTAVSLTYTVETDRAGSIVVVKKNKMRVKVYHKVDGEKLISYIMCSN